MLPTVAALDLDFDLGVWSVTICEFRAGHGLLFELLKSTCIYDEALRSTGTECPYKEISLVSALASDQGDRTRSLLGKT